MHRRIQGILSDHWHGRYAFLPTIVLTLLSLRYGLDWMGQARPTDWPLWLCLGLSAGSASVLVWQLVGGARTVARQGRDLFVSLAGGLALVVTGALFINAELTYWANRNAVPLALPEPASPYKVLLGAVILKGPIDFEMLHRLELTIAAFPDLKRVDLQSDGGRVPAARAIAQRIAAARLDTRAIGLCASACPLIFVAGQKRSLGPDGGLGFHAYELLRYDNLQNPREEEARDREYLIGRGISADFLDRVFATPPDQLWRPTRGELRNAGFLTQ